VAVILGDNIFHHSMEPYADEFKMDDEHECYLFLKPVDDPESFGIAWLDENDNVIRMEEKPKKPDSNLAITGLYIYSPRVYDLIEESLHGTGYSDRGELEITAINRLFMERGLVKGLSFDGHWADCGTIDSLLDVSKLMKGWDSGPWLPQEDD